MNNFSDVDEQGQPVNSLFNRKRRCDRTVDELIGMAKGMAADGVIVEAEARFLLSWLEKNREFWDQWPLDMLSARVAEMLSDGVLDREEQGELLSILKDLSGIDDIFGGEEGTAVQIYDDLASQLPVDSPPPRISFDKTNFCFTGKFVSGTRKEVEEAVKALGCTCSSKPSSKTDYLVIGVLGSKDWVHSSYSQKIDEAAELKQNNSGLL